MILAKRQNRTVYHWPESIKELIKARNKASANDSSAEEEIAYEALRIQACQAAGNWQLCACGSLCRSIPREPSPFRDNKEAREMAPNVDIILHKNAPKDERLRDLGLQFMCQIDRQDYNQALIVMNQIERRASTVLRKLGKKKHTYGPPLK